MRESSADIRDERDDDTEMSFLASAFSDDSFWQTHEDKLSVEDEKSGEVGMVKAGSRPSSSCDSRHSQ